MFKSNLKEISRGRYKSEKQESVLQNIKLLYEAPEAVIKLFDDYSLIAFEAKYTAILKILTPKQMFQVLPIPLAYTFCITNTS